MDPLHLLQNRGLRKPALGVCLIGIPGRHLNSPGAACPRAPCPCRETRPARLPPARACCPCPSHEIVPGRGPPGASPGPYRDPYPCHVPSRGRGHDRAGGRSLASGRGPYLCPGGLDSLGRGCRHGSPSEEEARGRRGRELAAPHGRAAAPLGRRARGREGRPAAPGPDLRPESASRPSSWGGGTRLRGRLPGGGAASWEPCGPARRQPRYGGLQSCGRRPSCRRSSCHSCARTQQRRSRGACHPCH
mmetsp:Transcript_2467/g.7096  ORF Transcript_2467/g.7096 Transcript_2467/m.7096 type:complete len:247 (-) Transcript_2467:575-1315(-)